MGTWDRFCNLVGWYIWICVSDSISKLSRRWNTHKFQLGDKKCKYSIFWFERKELQGSAIFFQGSSWLLPRSKKGQGYRDARKTWQQLQEMRRLQSELKRMGTNAVFPFFAPSLLPTCWSIHCRKTTKMWHSLESGSPWKLFVSIVEAFEHFEISRHMPLRIHLNFTFDLLVQTRFPIQKKIDIWRCTKPYSPPDREI